MHTHTYTNEHTHTHTHTHVHNVGATSSITIVGFKAPWRVTEEERERDREINIWLLVNIPGRVIYKYRHTEAKVSPGVARNLIDLEGIVAMTEGKRGTGGRDEYTKTDICSWR